MDPRKRLHALAALPLALDAVEAPLVPRAHDVVALEVTLAERAARVVARAVDRAEDAVSVREREAEAASAHLLELAPRELLRAAQVDPGAVRVSSRP